MQAVTQLTLRNIKLFFRDRTLFIMSLLAVFIVIALYALFLENIQVNAIKGMIGETDAIRILVNEWMIAGLLSIVPVTTTLGAFSIMIKDRETKKVQDFLITPITRAQIQLGYVVQSFFIGCLLTFITFILGEVFLLAIGGEWIGSLNFMKVIGIIILMVAMASTVNLLVCFFITSQGAFSTLSTIVGTGIGFLCGIYVPLGQLPIWVQKFVMLFPLSHPAVLLRQLFTESSLEEVFQVASVKMLHAYKVDFAIIYEWNDTRLSNQISVLYMVLTIVCCIILVIVLLRLKNK